MKRRLTSRTTGDHLGTVPAGEELPAGEGAALFETESDTMLLERRFVFYAGRAAGGVMDIGETIAETIVREVREETGLDVQPISLVGIYSDPRHVFAYDDGEVRQEFSVCFACTTIGGHLRVSDESSSVRFVEPSDLDDLDMHPSIRLRIRHYLEHRSQPVIQ